MHAAAAVLGAGLHPTAVEHHRRRRGRRFVAAQQLVLAKRLHFLITRLRPLLANPLAQTLHMGRTDRHLGQHFEILTRLFERCRLARLPHGFLQNPRTVAFGPQLELVV